MANISQIGYSVLILVIVFTIVCTLFIAMRFWAAKVSKRPFYADDALISFAYLNTVVIDGPVIWAIVNGMGQHITDLTDYEVGVQGKVIFFAVEIPWLLASVFVKLSVLWLYTRVFTTKKFKKWAYGLMGVVMCYCVVFLGIYMTNCRPIYQPWSPVPGGSCREMSKSDLATVGINLALELAVIILPMPALWGLQMPLRNKVSVTIMFSFGLITIGMMCWRASTAVHTRSSPDYTYNFPLTVIISFFELWLGIMAACIPTLAPLFRNYIEPMLEQLKFSISSSLRGTEDIVLIRVSNNSHTAGRYNQLDETEYKSLQDQKISVSRVATTTSSMHEPSSKFKTSTTREGDSVEQGVETTSL
ncbi:hypothetical protein F5X96DRAFT_634721 [Biscogniauxia mediterranea]|nr:hypothetical protein F5X96DRAFT_634721 [Biscogniauxia mediterranea]